ncbi:nucleoprotein [Paraavulavirus wisconsinense]|uniref:Nucleocapsid n=1 Tax=Paraavulavirus wisconsinense TaxID=3052594 RepID=D5FGX2_9MONO|nr:nucleoprotein [Paraavulavirus wisconsinense]ACI47548.1 nucleoprotein [Paraavulavirus wisconsinense]
MAGIFNTYELFVKDQTCMHKRAASLISGGQLKSNIPVFITTRDDPAVRWNLVCFNLRLIVSESSTSVIRQGAMISLLSVTASNMRALAAIAGQTDESMINIIEVVDFNGLEPQCDPRSGLDAQKQDMFKDIASDMPKVLGSGTPFQNVSAETNNPEDTHMFLRSAISVLTQIWILVAKAMTNIEGSHEASDRRLAKYTQQNRIDRRFMLAQATRTACQQIIKDSLTIRRFLVTELRKSRGALHSGSSYYAMVGDMQAYIFNAGLTPFLTTLRYGIGTKYHALAISSLTGDLNKIKGLLTLYKEKGSDAGYMALLEDADCMQFAPGNYALLYSYAMGVASVHDEGMRNYQYARRFLHKGMYQFGRDIATQHQHALDESLAQEMRITEADRANLKVMMANIGEASHYSDIPSAGPSGIPAFNDPPEELFGEPSYRKLPEEPQVVELQDRDDDEQDEYDM